MLSQSTEDISCIRSLCEYEFLLYRFCWDVLIDVRKLDIELNCYDNALVIFKTHTCSVTAIMYDSYVWLVVIITMTHNCISIGQGCNYYTSLTNSMR